MSQRIWDRFLTERDMVATTETGMLALAAAGGGVSGISCKRNRTSFVLR